MSIAGTVRDLMQRENVDYEIVEHQYTESSMHTAAFAHVPGDKLAKSVVLEDESGYVMVVVPSTHRVHLGRTSRQLKRQMGLATEDELRELFKDCATGAIPPTGQAYDMETLVDDRLIGQSDVYFEAGDHERLVHVGAEQFQQLMAGAGHGRFGDRV